MGNPKTVIWILIPWYNIVPATNSIFLRVGSLLRQAGKRLCSAHSVGCRVLEDLVRAASNLDLLPSIHLQN